MAGHRHAAVQAHEVRRPPGHAVEAIHLSLTRNLLSAFRAVRSPGQPHAGEDTIVFRDVVRRFC